MAQVHTWRSRPRLGMGPGRAEAEARPARSRLMDVAASGVRAAERSELASRRGGLGSEPRPVDLRPTTWHRRRTSESHGTRRDPSELQGRAAQAAVAESTAKKT